MASTTNFGRVRSRVDFSSLRDRLVKTLSNSKKREINRLSNFLRDLSANLIRFSPTSDKSKYSHNQYVNNTRIYFTNNVVSYMNDAGNYVTTAVPALGDYTESIPSQINGLQECLNKLSSGFIPNGISIVNDTKNESNGYAYWYNVEEIGWKSVRPSDTGDMENVHRVPYHTFRKAWKSTRGKYGIKRGVNPVNAYDK